MRHAENLSHLGPSERRSRVKCSSNNQWPERIAHGEGDISVEPGAEGCARLSWKAAKRLHCLRNVHSHDDVVRLVVPLMVPPSADTVKPSASVKTGAQDPPARVENA
jgi:hypothetical protein